MNQPCNCKCHQNKSVVHFDACCEGECPGCDVAQNNMVDHIVNCDKYIELVKTTKRKKRYQIPFINAFFLKKMVDTAAERR